MEPVFFSQHVDAALAKGDLDGAYILIRAAEADKLDGYGPPETEIIAAKRRWLDCHDRLKTLSAPVAHDREVA